ncbi:hypothetical protein QBZ16_002866 [Prototheca wickerhamii]|uniref:Uncharacterized protein n=1 Tax=Prototheca wickerhamii TaxID=3111 RepID=A0AAD9IM71_PROWI|nr:hypothetical protein QBZ16_002866 [Prototheca wickerhamii]
MDLPCNCLGVATAARVPVKRYNFLVPSVYRAEKDASLGKPTGPGVDRGIKKLCEYLARNPHRVPKAARRLARRLHRDLENRRLGEVQVSVEAYEKLIETLGPELVSLLASELAPRRNIFTACLRPCIAHEGLDHDVGASAIGQLLQDNASGVRVLGCELLATFVRQQGCSTQFRAAMEALVPLVCEAANPRRPFSGREHVSAAGLARLRDAAWATLLDYLAYEQRAAIRSLLRPAIVLAAFDALECHLLDEPEASGASTTAGPGSEAAQRAARLVDGVLAAAKPWQQLDDAATALLYMDRRGRWAAAAAAQRRGAGRRRGA